MSDGLFPTISFNLRESQRSLSTFFIKPGRLGGHIYQNVPKLRYILPVGKPWETFQS